MAYALASDFAVTPGSVEVAQVATPAHLDIVPAELMRLTLTGASRAEYSAEVIATADAALANVNAAIAGAEQFIDGFLASRYALPLTTIPQLLRTWTIDIAWYRLNQHRVTKGKEDPVVRRYDDAIKFLGLVRDGKFSLGANDPVVTDTDSDVLIETPGRLFTHDTLADY